MTNQTASLRQELDQSEHALAALSDELTAGGLSRTEQLMATVQTTLTAYRGRIIPRLERDHGRAGSAERALAAYDAIVQEELTRAVSRLEDLRRELVASGSPVNLQTQVNETLAVLRVLIRIAVSVGHEATIPNQV